ncbi:MAG: hypothetical protein KAI47_16110 [Deltaproteobacteria bacterium]|nr:hypothetical protein [Deltaproteobacteria bacterium]
MHQPPHPISNSPRRGLSWLITVVVLTSACPAKKRAPVPKTPSPEASKGSAKGDHVVGAVKSGAKGLKKAGVKSDAKGVKQPSPKSDDPKSDNPKSDDGASSQAPEGGGVDFIADARLLYEVAACPGQRQPKVCGFDARVLKTHCQRLRSQMVRYRKVYVDKARPFLTALAPKDLPTRVVYPFGGGDLLTALTTYAHAQEITTISLEHVGDVRGVRRLRGRKLAGNLKTLRQTIGGLLALSDSTSVNMMKMQRTPIPGQLAFFLTALAIYDLEPVSLRYFSIEASGKLHYYTKEEIAGLDKKRAKRLSGGWVDPTGSPAFSNAEMTFRRRGDPKAPLIIHRHVAANLANSRLPATGPLLVHLGAKGPFVAMTKAAAYMIWRRDFSHLRDLLLKKMVYMVSDSTGIPPSHLKAHGFQVTTFGRYSQCFFEKRFNPKTDEQFVRLWRRQRYHRLPFRYGYPDRKGHWHMMIAKKVRH